jgi:hypothetical protein
MRSLLMKSMAGGSLLLMALAAHAQDRDRYRDDDRYSDGDDRQYRREEPYRYLDRDDHGYRREEQYSRGGGSLIERVQSDLRYADSDAYSRGERKRIDSARKELYEFQRAWSTGRFDRHELDDSIAAIQKVVDHNTLRDRARSILWADLQRLRSFRAEYQGRGYPRY